MSAAETIRHADLIKPVGRYSVVVRMDARHHGPWETVSGRTHDVEAVIREARKLATVRAEMVDEPVSWSVTYRNAEPSCGLDNCDHDHQPGGWSSWAGTETSGEPSGWALSI